MLRRRISSATCTIICALAFYPAVAQADSIPTITITSAAGYASWGDFNILEGCQGICASLYGPSFELGFGAGVPSNVFFQANPGYSFPPIEFSPAAPIGLSPPPGGEVTLGGVDYPVDFGPGSGGGVEVTQEGSFIVPSSGTVQIPAVLTGSGTACVEISPSYGCQTVNGVFYPVLVAYLDFDIQGFLTFEFYPSYLSPYQVFYVATFTPAPESSSALLLIAAFVIMAAWHCRRALFQAIRSLARITHTIGFR